MQPVRRSETGRIAEVKPPPTHHQIADSATILSIASVASPAAGVLVETVLAWRYGVSFVVDGFRVAYLLIAFGGALFFAQLLPNVIIPMFSEIRAKYSDADAWRFALSYGLLAGGCLMTFSIWVWMSPDALFRFLGPGLTGPGLSEGRLMLRYFIFSFSLMVWSGVMNGVLNAYRIFAILPLAQFVANLLLAAAIMLAPTIDSKPLIIGVVAGAVSTVTLHVIALVRLARQQRLLPAAILRLCPRALLLRAMWVSAPLVGMIAVQYYTIALYNRALSMLPSGSIAEVGYAWKMLTLASFVPTALATVVFPNLSAMAANPDGDTSRIFDRCARMTLFLTVPLVALLYLHKSDLVKILLARGAMQESGAQAIANLFGILLLSAPAIAMSGIIYKFLYVKQTTVLPAAISVLTAIVVLGLVPYAARTSGVAGVAMASTICTWLTCLMSFAGLLFAYRVGNIRSLLTYTGRLALVTAAALIPSALLVCWFRNVDTLPGRMILLGISAAMAAAMLFWLSRWSGIEESGELWSYAVSRAALLRNKMRRSADDLTFA